MPRSLYELQFDSRNLASDRLCTVYKVWGGELTLSAGSSVTLQEGLSAPISISKSVWRGRGSYRRSAGIARRVEDGCYRISFVEGGRLISGATDRIPSLSGNCFAVTKGSVGYNSELLPERGRDLVVYVALVPQHLLAPLLAPGANLGCPIPTTGADGAFAQNIVRYLFEAGASLAPAIRDATIDLFLAIVAKSITPAHDEIASLSTRNDRLREIEDFLRHHLAEPKLSARVVARQCHISTRYLSLLLHRNGTSFPEMLRSMRVSLARSMLASDNMRFCSIGQIALLAGFKNVPHFNRAFKAIEGTTPSDFRRARTISGKLPA